MKIISLVENISHSELEAGYGLALYIETEKHTLLFDLGPDETIIRNAKKRGIDLSLVDTVIISHGHWDHGGALEAFLKINDHAKIYIQKEAFAPHFRKYMGDEAYIGLETSLMENKQFVLLTGDHEIDEELFLFTVTNIEKNRSEANDTLFMEDGLDRFSHEQSLIIKGEKNTLIMGCGHTGVTNIMEKAAVFAPKVCIGGFHLYNPTTKKTVSDALLENIAAELSQYDTDFYTCHCTGEEAFRYLSEKLRHMEYFSCGEAIGYENGCFKKI
ncbi:MAG: MBL fold metallo-hydrolase [Clostridiales bacterium]|nr:MBL fold metallo-hydrolase [Clostridiales bacterium]